MGQMRLIEVIGGGGGHWIAVGDVEFNHDAAFGV